MLVTYKYGGVLFEATIFNAAGFWMFLKYRFVVCSINLMNFWNNNFLFVPSIDQRLNSQYDCVMSFKINQDLKKILLSKLPAQKR